MSTLQELLDAAGIETYGAPLSTSIGGNLGTQEDIYSIIGNPLFQLQQGLTTPEEFQQSMQMLAAAPITQEEMDYGTLEAGATGDLSLGYDLIKQGYTPNQVLTSLLGVLEERDLSNVDSAVIGIQKDKINLMKDDLEEFYKRWNRSNQVIDGLSSGDFFQGADLKFYEQLPYDEAQKAYAAAGLPKGLQNPWLWRTVPDANLLAEAAKGDARAEQLTKDLSRQKILTEGKARKEGAAAGSAAYQEFLSRTPEGRRFLEQERAKAEGKKPGKSVAQKAKEAFMLGNIPVVGLPIAGAKAGAGVVKGAVNLVKDTGFNLPGRSGIKDLVSRAQDAKKAAEAAQRAAENQAYWAKMTETYTAKGVQDQARQPIKDIEKQLADAQRLAYEKRLQASQQGTIPAIQLIEKAGPMAGLLATPTPKPTYVKPKPRVLSDQEIESMATMIAGGMI